MHSIVLYIQTFCYEVNRSATNEGPFFDFDILLMESAPSVYCILRVMNAGVLDSYMAIL